jgi:hypothetical protein
MVRILSKKDKWLPKSLLQLPDLELSKELFETALVSPRHDGHRQDEFVESYYSGPRLGFNGVAVFRVKVRF